VLEIKENTLWLASESETVLEVHHSKALSIGRKGRSEFLDFSDI
jgi:hypothetical protein